MAKFFSRKVDWVFGGVALALFSVLAGYAIYTISFIAMHMNNALQPGGEGGQLIENFDFDKLNQLVGSEFSPPGQ